MNKCQKCGGEVEKGKMIAGGTVSPNMVWVKGSSILKFGAPKIKSISCKECGFIENYVDRK